MLANAIVELLNFIDQLADIRRRTFPMELDGHLVYQDEVGAGACECDDDRAGREFIADERVKRRGALAQEHCPVHHQLIIDLMQEHIPPRGQRGRSHWSRRRGHRPCGHWGHLRYWRRGPHRCLRLDPHRQWCWHQSCATVGENVGSGI